jgi:GTPase
MEVIMIKTASTREIIEILEAYEKINGVGSVISIGSVCSGRRDVEYVFYIKDHKYGKEVRVEIPSIDEADLWEMKEEENNKEV